MYRYKKKKFWIKDLHHESKSQRRKMPLSVRVNTIWTVYPRVWWLCLPPSRANQYPICGVGCLLLPFPKKEKKKESHQDVV